MSVKAALSCRRTGCLSLNLRNNTHHYRHSQPKSDKHINSYDAVKKIKDLQKYNKQNMITEAYGIYNNLHQAQRNEFVINALLNCCKEKMIDNDTIKIIDHVKNLINNNNDYIHVKNSLINIYGRIGDIDNAIEIFNNIPDNKKDIISITSLMNAYNNNKDYNKSIALYQQYDGQHDDISKLLFLKACSNISDYDKGKTLINTVIENADKNIIKNHSVEISTTLIDFYGKHGDIKYAKEIFKNIPEKSKNIVCIGAMMNAYNNHQQYDESIKLYEEYNGKHNDISNLLFLKACVNSGNSYNYDKGQKIIDSIMRKNRNDLSMHRIELLNTLIDFYGKVEDSNNALRIFNNIPSHKKDVVSITAMMNAYNNNDEYSKTIALYEQCINDKYDNDVSNILYIKACANSGDYNKGIKLIDTLIKDDKDINNHSIELINTLIDFYGKLGDITNALNIFHNVPKHKRDNVCIGTMMSAYNNNDEYEKTLNLFNEIKHDKRIKLDEYMYCIALIAAGNLVSPHQGATIIDDLNRNNKNILKSMAVQSSMITYYAKCDNCKEAIRIFTHNINEYDGKDSHGLLYLYAAMIDCYAKTGNIKQLLLLFDDLKKDDRIKKISKNIFKIILNGCSHFGLIDEARSIFEEMKDKYKLNGYDNINNIDIQIIQCITALIDCFGRKGGNQCLDEAENLYSTYIENNKNIYYKLKLDASKSLLSSCRIHNDIKRGERICTKMDMILNENKHEFDNLSDENKEEIGAVCVLLSNIYGQNKQFDKVNKIRERMKRLRIETKPGI